MYVFGVADLRWMITHIAVDIKMPPEDVENLIKGFYTYVPYLTYTDVR